MVKHTPSSDDITYLCDVGPSTKRKAQQSADDAQETDTKRRLPSSERKDKLDALVDKYRASLLTPAKTSAAGNARKQKIAKRWFE